MTRRTLGLVLLLAGAGCGPGTGHGRATHRGAPAERTLGDVPVCGSDVEVELRPPGGADVLGELIAADEAELVVLGERGPATIGREAVARVVVHVLPQVRAVGGLWTFAGTLSTVSHGGYLLLTAPAWILVGSLSTAFGLAPDERWAFPGDAPELREYARFPQGLPAGWPSPEQPPPRCPE